MVKFAKQKETELVFKQVQDAEQKEKEEKDKYMQKKEQYKQVLDEQRSFNQAQVKKSAMTDVEMALNAKDLEMYVLGKDKVTTMIPGIQPTPYGHNSESGRSQKP